MAMPPLSALRAFEAAARHLSLTQAAGELNVTPGALSHQIRALEEMLGVKLFERRVRAIALTAAGRQLYPGLQTGFAHIRDAVASFDAAKSGRVLVLSTSPGLTAKWLVPRLYRFAAAHPDIDIRISATATNANFVNDGIDMALRNMAVPPKPDATLEFDLLTDVYFVPVCSPRLLEKHGPIHSPDDLARFRLIHDESLPAPVARPDWSVWFKTAGSGAVDLRRGLRFNSADHALDAACEGAGVLLTYDILAYDDLRSGHLVMPFPLALGSNRAFYLVGPKNRKRPPAADAFRDWIKDEIAALDWRSIRHGAAHDTNTKKR
ncbi:transcriptional regulator GcvA [Undibacter mobilis]|uniref:Transcriptional regulator GcvA n=1 Tax=Undibacter mobilis TaxID=2292256 RepID=A0A371B9E3_9BRAD|nr:transcriptional regulator GcvA [Undibacter mobilis]RDV04043.1 transcriptional regulator GcvA [Undibacter mobilis]